MTLPRLHWFLRLFLAGLAGFAGLIVGAFGAWNLAETLPYPTKDYPLPHHIPKYAGGVTLRFAMVHDVLHERYPRHGKAYYEERNRRVKQALLEMDGKRLDEEYGLLDDLGVGLEMLGRRDEAVEVMRDKLRKQEAAGLTGRDLYTTYADLGTFLIHRQAAEGFADKAKAKERLHEGLDFIRKSIEVNPEAHFGREVWQAVAVEFLLATLDDPNLLLRYDLVGDQLDKDVDPRITRCIADGYWWGDGNSNALAAEYINEPGDKPPPKYLREAITRVGAERGWENGVLSSHKSPVPFDEPTLGVIGMWRLGAGANPHFALALGEIMLRVGQRYIAWCAYERAVQLSSAVNKNPEIVEGFVAHCRARQALIEKGLPAEDAAALRPRFEKELAFGKRYQEDYQAYEAKRIEEGASIEDPNFYDAFDAEHGSIASPVGEEDKFVVEKRFFVVFYVEAGAVLFAGLFAFPTACLLRWFFVRRVEKVPAA